MGSASSHTHRDIFENRERHKRNVWKEGIEYTCSLVPTKHNPGFPGYSGLGFKRCSYCHEKHDIVVCPYEWYYEEKNLVKADESLE